MAGTIILTIQIIVSFTIPFIFGWIVLRRIIKENNLLFLIPASLVVGFGMLMVVMNELRFFWEMNLSVWFTYKILLIMAVALALFVRDRLDPLELPAFFQNRFFISLYLLAVIFLTVYFGLPGFRGVLNDGWWGHYLFAISIQTVEKFPLPPAFSPDDMVYYHYGPDILAATWSYLFNKPVQFGFALNIVIFIPVTFLITFALTYSTTKNFISSFLAGIFILIAGNLRFFYLFNSPEYTPGSVLSALNGQSIEGLLEMAFTPSHLLGVPFVLTAVGIFQRLKESPDLEKGVVFGLLLGIMTLIAEWYFIMLFTTCFLYAIYEGIKKGHSVERKKFYFVLSFSLIFSFSIGLFNNTYLAGYFSNYWLKPDDFARKAYLRNAQYMIEARKTEGAKEEAAKGEAAEGINLFKVTHALPDLTPIRLNTARLGYVPSWKSGGSNAEAWEPIWSLKILSEAFPVLLLGLIFGYIMWRKHKNATTFMLFFMAVIGTLPPIFLTWGYRSSDFLRFFTASFGFAAILLAMTVGSWWALKRRGLYLLCGLITLFCLINPFILGIIGLMPSTLRIVDHVSSTASALNDVLQKPHSIETEDRKRCFENLSTLTGQFLYPLTKGRDRVIVIVPQKYLPPQEIFPEWMKMGTYARINIPVGPHWVRSGYTELYEKVVEMLSSKAISILDAKYIILTNLFKEGIPENVVKGLGDPKRFIHLNTFQDGPYWMKIYKII